jgi:hypothetical protein
LERRASLGSTGLGMVNGEKAEENIQRSTFNAEGCLRWATAGRERLTSSPKFG